MLAIPQKLTYMIKPLCFTVSRVLEIMNTKKIVYIVGYQKTCCKNQPQTGLNTNSSIRKYIIL